MSLAESIYHLTADFPSEERFGLVTQMRRCAVSVPSDIAEGHGRLTTRDWQHFLSQARGSAQELETQLMLSQRLGLGDTDGIQAALSRAEEVGKIINGLLQSTRARSARKVFQPD
jgi:four helix bundle protein